MRTVMLALLLVGCSTGDTLVVVTVNGALADVALHVHSTAGGQSSDHDFAGPLNLPQTFGVDVAANITGLFTTTVEALGSGGSAITSGSGSAMLKPGSRVDVVVNLDFAADLGPLFDMALPPDLTPPPPDMSCPALVMLPATKDFGPLNAGMTASQTFTVQDVALPTTALTVMVTGSSDFVVGTTNTCTGLSLGNLATCMVSVDFNPTNAGARNAMLVVSDGRCTGTAPLTGVAVGINSDVCTDDSQCQSGHCTDGYCCDKSAAMCTGCQACNVAGNLGTCSNVLAGDDPHNACATACQDKCNGSNACRAAAAGTVCAPTDPCANGGGSCTPSNAPGALIQATSSGTTEHKCDGSSTACPSTLVACAGNFICAAGICKTSCTVDTDCLGGTYCQGGSCTGGQGGQGATCSRQGQCQQNLQCVGSKCVACASNRDCYLQLCQNGVCVAPSGSCSGSGFGNTLIAAGQCSVESWCSCSAGSDCYSNNPSCPTSTCGAATVGQCMCGSTICQPSQTCVSGTSCKTATNYRCCSNSDCASGSCVNNLCT
jgi:hypothetical protein